MQRVGGLLGFDVFASSERGSVRVSAHRDDRVSVRFELATKLQAQAAVGVQVDPDEGEVLFNAGLGLRAFLGIESPRVRALAKRLCPDGKARAIDAYITPDDGGLDGLHAHWNLWTPTCEWSHTTPRWRNGGAFLWTLVFGDTTCTTTKGDPQPVEIPMPEGVYPGVGTVEHRTWTRPRWPFGPWYEARSITIESKGGVPMPGKGENAWDLDDDALFASSSRSRTLGEAVGEFVGAVLERRERHAGLTWRPTPKPPTGDASPAPATAEAAPRPVSERDTFLDEGILNMVTGCRPPSELDVADRL